MNDQENSERGDPLIDEIRQIRAEISRQFDDDIDKLCQHLIEVQRSTQNRLVREPALTTGPKPRTAS